MKLDFKDLPNKLRPVLQFIKRYVSFGFVLLLLLIFGFFVLRINLLSRMNPSEEAVEEKLQTVQRPKLDKTVLEKIDQLKSQNIQVQSLFDKARNNPFNE